MILILYHRQPYPDRRTAQRPRPNTPPRMGANLECGLLKTGQPAGQRIGPFLGGLSNGTHAAHSIPRVFIRVLPKL